MRNNTSTSRSVRSHVANQFDSVSILDEVYTGDDFAQQCNHAYAIAKRAHHNDVYIDTASFIESLGL